jgi:hypothetical protein
MYLLRAGEKYVISWALLAKTTGLAEEVVCPAALDLRENGFFDQESLELGVVSLTDQQYSRGRLGASILLVARLVSESRLWQALAALTSLLLALVVWAVGNFVWDFVGPALHRWLAA